MKSSKSLVLWLFVLASLMFGFSFALIPLYRIFCEFTGLNGKIDIQNSMSQNISSKTRYKINNNSTSKRLIIVEFDSNRNQRLPCNFSPNHTALQVIPGELTSTSYTITNLTNKKMTIQAIPSISPGIAAKHLKKLECFCFEQQDLKPNETLILPLRFWLETEMPEDIHRLTLSYTIFDVTKPALNTK